MCVEDADLIAALRNSATDLLDAAERCAKLEAALRKLTDWRDGMSADEPGYPEPDPGCLECTSGQTPNRHITGPCPWHNAKHVLSSPREATR